MSARVHLLLFPYAGGAGSSLRDFAAGLPQWIDAIPVTLPGRGGRFRESPVTEWVELSKLLADELVDQLNGPYACFGHSLGALVGLEVAYRLREQGAGDPVWFGASGCIAPSERTAGEDWLGCDEVSFIEKLRKLDGTPEEFLENRELLELYLPALRADFHLAANHVPSVRDPLSCRLLVLSGAEDSEVSAPRIKLEAWSREVVGVAQFRVFPGGHFFINEQAETIARICAADLATALRLEEGACA